MSNPTYATENLTREAGKLVGPFRLVKQVEGKIEHAGAADFPFGAVTEAAEPKADREANNLTHGLPHVVRVHAAQAIVKIDTDDEGFTEGADVFAGDDGKAAKSGNVKVGIADRAEKDGKVRVHLFHPSIFVAAGA